LGGIVFNSPDSWVKAASVLAAHSLLLTAQVTIGVSDESGGALAACMRVHRLATGEVVTSSTQNVPQLPNHKVKVKKVGQRACNEKDAKGKFCGGHLKRWFYTKDSVERECGDIEKTWGPDAEVYRCENCKALYLPNPEEEGQRRRGGDDIGIRVDAAAEREVGPSRVLSRGPEQR
jgi:hypothetical protein